MNLKSDNPNLEWYFDCIRHEMERLSESKFIGNIDFKVNFREGSIANMNIVLTKSIKKIGE